MKKILWLFLIYSLVLFIPISAYAASNVPQKILDLRPSVVRVVCDFGDGTGGIGTGFAVGTQEPVQYIVTNYHVVEGNPDGVEVWYGDETFINATVLAELPSSDICILKLEKPIYDIKPMIINDRDDAQTGDSAYALGFPGGADDFTNVLTANPDQVTVTDGIISSIKSFSLFEGRSPVMLYQINVAINHGNSGGPLVNENGEVIGINSFGAIDAQDINAAISILELTGLLKQNGITYRTGNFFLNNIWIIIVIAAAATAAVLVILIKRGKVRVSVKKFSKNIPLEKYLLNMGGKLPFEMAANVLASVIRKLAEMHAKGMCHLDICPENITVDSRTHTAILLEPGKKDAGGYTILTRPGFSPIEQYKTNGDIGTWTDVYAIGAILYRMVMGNNPPEALTRMENDAALSNNIIEHVIEYNKKQAWIRALNISVEGRTRNCELLAVELLVTGEENVETILQQAGINADDGQINKKAKKERRRTKKKWIPIAIAGAVAVAAVSYFGWVEYNYQKLVGYVENEYFTQAADIIPKLPLFYKDAENLQNYNYAGLQMEQGNYDKARQGFRDLEGFQKSEEMLKEVDYQEAFSILDSGDYDGAKKTFIKLGEYKNALDMLTECDYQKAADLVKKENFLGAYAILDDIQGYADVNDMLLLLTDTIYYKGVELYESGDKSGSMRCFKAVDGYMDSDIYIKLIDAQNSLGEEGYNDLIQLAGFEDAVDIIMSDDFIYYYLLGRWSDGSGNFFLIKKGEGEWKYRAEHILPCYDGDFFNIRDSVYYMCYNDSDQEREQFKFTFVSPNEMTLYCYKNNRTYGMYRE